MICSNMICSNTNLSDINLTTAKSIPLRIAFLLVGAMCMLLAAIPDTVDARGSGRAAGGGISRSSPAAGGSLSSRATAERPVVERPAIPTKQARTARSAGDIPPTRAAGSANGAQSASGARSADGVGQTRAAGETRSIGQTRGAAVAEKPTAAEMAAYRQQFQQQNKDRDTDRDRDNWDRPVDPDYNVPVIDRPVVPAVVVGAAAGAIASNRVDGYVDYVNTVPDPAYLSEDACSLKAMTAVNDVTYYRCSDAWYKRGYQSGNVVYIPTDPPAGY